MSKKIFYLFLILLAVAQMSVHAKRIVTLAPAITEIVFALGKGDEIIGCTRFCNFPEAAKKIPRVGGFMDVNLEVLISKRPEIIFLYPEFHEKIKIMEKKTEMVVVKHADLNDLYDAVKTIAGALQMEARGKALVSQIKNRLNLIREKSSAKGKKKVKVLLIIGRNPDKLTNMYIIGAKDFLNQLMDAAGGVNAYTGSIRYPSISIESVVAMNPDVIIELSSFNEGIDEKKVLELWKKFSFISAVKRGKIKIIKDSVWLIPGPRVAQVAEKMYRLFFDENEDPAAGKLDGPGFTKASNKH